MKARGAVEREFLPTLEWRQKLAEGVLQPVRWQGAVVKDAGESPSATSTFVASTAAADRYGDVVELGGWKVEGWRANPVVLWAHSHYQLPVGKGRGIEVGADALRVEVQWPTPEEYEFGATVGRLVKAGFLSAVSVGFLPRAFEERFEEDETAYKGRRLVGYTFREVELLEVSVVPVPANPQALVTERGLAGVLGQWVRHQAPEATARQWQLQVRGLLDAAEEAAAEAQVRAVEEEKAAKLEEVLRQLAALRAEVREVVEAARRAPAQTVDVTPEGLVSLLLGK